METYYFYKSIYDRELNRKIDLDNSINLPVTILTLIVGLNSLYIKKGLVTHFFENFGLSKAIIVLVTASIILSIFFLVKSYNNLFKGFSYRNLALISKIRHFEITAIPEYNEQVDEKEKMDFETELINRLILVTDNHTNINDKRRLDLYRAKTFLIISLILTVIQLITFTFK